MNMNIPPSRVLKHPRAENLTEGQVVFDPREDRGLVLIAGGCVEQVGLFCTFYLSRLATHCAGRRANNLILLQTACANDLCSNCDSLFFRDATV